MWGTESEMQWKDGGGSPAYCDTTVLYLGGFHKVAERHDVQCCIHRAVTTSHNLHSNRAADLLLSSDFKPVPSLQENSFG